MINIDFRSSNSPESGLGMSRSSLPDSDVVDGVGDEYYDLEPMPILGTCTVLYTFEGKEK